MTYIVGSSLAIVLALLGVIMLTRYGDKDANAPKFAIPKIKTVQGVVGVLLMLIIIGLVISLIEHVNSGAVSLYGIGKVISIMLLAVVMILLVSNRET